MVHGAIKARRSLGIATSRDRTTTGRVIDAWFAVGCATTRDLMIGVPVPIAGKVWHNCGHVD